jgi:hypothetical protein
MTDTVLGVAGYGANAAALVQQYESVSFADATICRRWRACAKRDTALT